MTKKAVDVVLLPDEHVTDVAIEANGALVAGGNTEIILNRNDYLPHISLAMGTLHDRDLPAVATVLEDIARTVRLPRLCVFGVSITCSGSGKLISSLLIQKTAGLQALHERVLRELQTWLGTDATAEMFYDPAEVAESSLSWVKNYKKQSSYEMFFPHITLGYGRVTDVPLPIEFTPTSLAVCHLGNHCTCREVLASIDLDRKQ